MIVTTPESTTENMFIFSLARKNCVTITTTTTTCYNKRNILQTFLLLYIVVQFL